uniref:Uncharacterized protein n=1 Tax=Aegilops tauschii TaxID=37682 RepID=M8C4I6_AEGTA
MAAAAGKEVDMKKMELMKEVRAHQVAIGELNNLPPSRAAYQKTCNIFFRKDIKSAVASQQTTGLWIQGLSCLSARACTRSLVQGRGHSALSTVLLFVVMYASSLNVSNQRHHETSAAGATLQELSKTSSLDLKKAFFPT